MHSPARLSVGDLPAKDEHTSLWEAGCKDRLKRREMSRALLGPVRVLWR